MKIHGRKPIRSLSISVESNYENYRCTLRQDFNCTCGYCGKTEAVSRRNFEIDHFVPQRLAPELYNEYGNLVYSCFNCNRKKSGKFPTENKKLSCTEYIGIFDPTTIEFDEHLERNMEGDIVGLTTVGSYVCDKIFKFNQRPMRQVWKAMQIIEKKTVLKNKILSNQISSELTLNYIEIDEMLTNLLSLFFDKSE